ncbi:hypothetical protein BAE44_0011433 [Dichanthelium oligosanthes]|uniref:DUF295 domain-containing protein n=1 Tax=Dichanthelium oligosanthes TaxID=888268 RepID=A0A1E5VR09_9POAL|nr:hypothetical protein BAE44_0011433 [Dichanthelium oligosanthes]
MGICFSISRRRKTCNTPTPAWSDLPPELAGIVLGWLPSHTDRVRFAAVCWHWHLAARQQRPLIPLPLPWISFNNGHFQSLSDGEAHALPDPGCALLCNSTFGGLVLLEVDDPARTCVLLDPFGGVSMVLPPPPCRYRSDASYGRSDHYYNDPYYQYPRCSAFRKLIIIGICRPGVGATCALHIRGDGDTWYEDFAFFRGKLYAIDNRGDLYEFDLTTDDSDGGCRSVKVPACVIQHAPRQEEPEPALAAAPQGARRTTRRYLVVSSDNDELLMVRWSIVEYNHVDACHTSALGPAGKEPVMAFGVFQADLKTSAWSEMTTSGALEDQVLFVSRSCSLTLRASDYKNAGGGDVRGNRVFYLEDDGFARYVARGRK